MGMEDALKNKVESEGFLIKNTIRDNVLHVVKDKKDYIYKTSEKRWETFSSILGKIFALTGINRQNFRNEIAIHQHLSGQSFETLRVPELYDTDGKSYLVMDYIEGTMGRWYTPEMDKVLIRSLVDLQLSIINKKNLLEYNVLSFLRRPFWNVIRMVWTIALPKLGFIIAFKCFALCLRLQRSVSPNKSPLLLHKDINNKGNIISNPQGEMYFIDFESCLQESKWVLTDIIEIIYSFKDEYMDVALFEIYIQKMRAEGFIDRDFDVKSQVRFAMLRNAIKYLGFDQLFISHRKQLLQIILPDEKYDLWFYETFEKENATL
jgi:predicted Ser/Thr protein kinase